MAFSTANADWFVPHPAGDSELLAQLEFLPGLREILMVRQVHALEHATVWVLSENDSDPAASDQIGGVSTERGFFLYGQVDRDRLLPAARGALRRLQAGEWDLALHPRCGTNLSAAIVLAASLNLGAHLLLPRNIFVQLLGAGLSATAAAQLAPDVGRWAQKYLTTAIPFNLELTSVAETTDFWGRPAMFVGARWRELQ